MSKTEQPTSPKTPANRILEISSCGQCSHYIPFRANDGAAGCQEMLRPLPCAHHAYLAGIAPIPDWCPLPVKQGEFRVKNRTVNEPPTIDTWAMLHLSIDALRDEAAGIHRHSPIRFTDGKQWFRATSVACGPVEGEIMVCLEKDHDSSKCPCPNCQRVLVARVNSTLIPGKKG